MWGGSPEPPARETGAFVAKSKALECSGKNCAALRAGRLWSGAPHDENYAALGVRPALFRGLQLSVPFIHAHIDYLQGFCLGFAPKEPPRRRRSRELSE